MRSELHTKEAIPSIKAKHNKYFQNLVFLPNKQQKMMKGKDRRVININVTLCYWLWMKAFVKRLESSKYKNS